MSVTLGLISDTHMDDRCRVLPPTVTEAFDGVDLILHAGDVGAMHTLDVLAQIAPVVAVHGNDEWDGAPEMLPSRQVLFAGSQRILLTHGHHPDPAVEQALRKVDDWQPKLARWAQMAHEVGASIIVYGHTHIPWHTSYNGIWIINPGAIASGSHFTRQITQTVARLTLNDGAEPVITYLNLADLSPYTPTVDPRAGFAAAIINEPIAAPEVFAAWEWLHQQVYLPAPEPAIKALRRVMYRCLDGVIPRINISDIVAEVLSAPDIPAEVKACVDARWPLA